MEPGRAGKLDALEPRRDGGNVRFRIDSVLHGVYQMPPSMFAAVTARIKVHAGLTRVQKVLRVAPLVDEV